MEEFAIRQKKSVPSAQHQLNYYIMSRLNLIWWKFLEFFKKYVLDSIPCWLEGGGGDDLQSESFK